MSDKIAVGSSPESVQPASEQYHATGEFSGSELPPADLKGRAVRGGAITFVAQVIKVVINMGSTVALARLLTPADYGLIAMVTGVTGFVEMFKDAGLSTATVQRERITNEQISTLFWLNVAMSFGLMLMVVALAPFLGVFYHEPRLVWVTVVLAGTFLCSGLTVQHQALLRRNMKFKQLAVIDVVSIGAGLASAIVMAVLGYRYWALVGMAVASSLVNAVAVWIAMPWRPGPPRRGCDVRPMIGFGGGIIGTRFLYAFVRNTPNVLLGWAWGAAEVGLYQRAYALLMFAVDQIQTPVTAVAIAPMSRLQSDWPRLRRYFLAGYSVVISCILPIVATCAVYANEIIEVLLGRQWLAAVGIFRWLSLAGRFRWAAKSPGNVTPRDGAADQVRHFCSDRRRLCGGGLLRGASLRSRGSRGRLFCGQSSYLYSDDLRGVQRHTGDVPRRLAYRPRASRCYRTGGSSRVGGQDAAHWIGRRVARCRHRLLPHAPGLRSDSLVRTRPMELLSRHSHASHA